MANNPQGDTQQPDFDVPWLERWRAADFSWPGLAKHRSWLTGQGGTLQEFLRAMENQATDADLLERGILIGCGEYGVFHVLFVPEDWAESQQAAISAPDLLAAKERYWQGLFTNGPLRDGSDATLSGVHLPLDVERRLVSSARASFDWVRFNSELRSIPRRGDRSFTWCFFGEQLNFYGRANAGSGECTVHFTWCEFAKPIILEKVSNLDSLDLNGSSLHEKLEVSDSDLSIVRLDHCDAKSLSITETSVRGPLTIGGSTIEWIEWINCTFDAHVLLVDSEIKKSIGLLACDFRSRLTLAEITWPASSYGCASASGSKFDGIVEIAGGEPPPVQLFQEAEFRSKVSLNSFSDRSRRESFKKELAAVGSQSEQTFNKQKHAQDVESGCRTLRKVAEAAGDVQSEQLWHRAELIARRARGESAASEKSFSSLYGLLADYGLSISRPFVVLGAAMALFALIYAWIGGMSWFGSIDWRSIEEGLGYSLNRTLPIGVFAEDHNAWREHLLGSSGQVGDIAVRAIATAQTIFSATLIYLGVMAIRRKFRIS